MKKVCMIVQNPKTKGGIAAVVNGYRGSKLERDYSIRYIESYKDGSKIQKFFKALSGYFQFALLLMKDKPDLIHIHSSFGPSFYRKLPYIYMATFAHIPIINHIHGSEFSKFYTDAGKRKQILVRNVWNHCDKFIVLSEEWKKTFSVAIPVDKIYVVENYSKLVLGIERKNNQRILFLGMINRMKGCYDIVDVVDLVSRQIPNVKMIMCGVGEVDKLKEKAESMGIADRFEFPGWVSDAQKDKELREANMLFLPSYTEGMPMSILEAMGYGLPIVASNVGGIPKIVRDNGGMCNPGDVNGFASLIINLFNDDDALYSAGEKSWKIVQKEYSLDAHISQIEQVYESCLV